MDMTTIMLTVDDSVPDDAQVLIVDLTSSPPGANNFPIMFRGTVGDLKALFTEPVKVPPEHKIRIRARKLGWKPYERTITLASGRNIFQIVMEEDTCAIPTQAVVTDAFGTFGTPPAAKVVDDLRALDNLRDAQADMAVRHSPILDNDRLQHSFSRLFKAGPGVKFMWLKQGEGEGAPESLKEVRITAVREKRPIWLTGSPQPIATTYGKRGFAGNLTFVNPPFDVKKLEHWDELRIYVLDGERLCYFSIQDVEFLKLTSDGFVDGKNDTVVQMVDATYVASGIVPWTEVQPWQQIGLGPLRPAFTPEERVQVIGDRICEDIKEVMGKFAYQAITPHLKQAMLCALDEVLRRYHMQGIIEQYVADDQDGMYYIRFGVSRVMDPEGRIKLRLPWFDPTRLHADLEYYKNKIRTGLQVDLETTGLLESSAMGQTWTSPVDTYFDLPLYAPEGTTIMVKSMLTSFVMSDEYEWVPVEGGD